MKVTCIKKNLSSALNISSRIIGSGGSLPILNNILFKTDVGRLKISSTNLEMAINTWVVGRVEEEGELTVPAKLINDYVNNLVAEKLNISTENQTLFIETDQAQTHIKGLPAEEFPLIPQITEGVYTKLDAQELKRGIEEVVFAATFSETQPEISGVLFSFGGRTLTLAATDRYRLAERVVGLADEVSSPRQVIIPARAVNEIGRVISSGQVEVYLSETQICLKTLETELISRLIEGKYPDYKQIIPKDFLTEAEVDKEAFVQSLKAVSLFASENNNIEFHLTPPAKQIVIKSQSAQVGDSEIRLETNLTGQKNSIIFNFRYLLDCLNHLGDEKITLKVIDSNSPAAISPIGRDNYLYIVMPIKI